MSNKLSLIKSKITLTRSLNKNKIINNTLWFLFWVIVYHISMAIGAESIFLPMLLNLPLATFFCLSVILQLLSVSILLYPQSTTGLPNCWDGFSPSFSTGDTVISSTPTPPTGKKESSLDFGNPSSGFFLG